MVRDRGSKLRQGIRSVKVLRQTYKDLCVSALHDFGGGLIINI